MNVQLGKLVVTTAVLAGALAVAVALRDKVGMYVGGVVHSSPTIEATSFSEVGHSKYRKDGMPSWTITSEDRLSESWYSTRQNPVHKKTMTDGYELIREMPSDQWSADIQTALIAFIGNQLETIGQTDSGRISANIVCRSRGCMIQIQENDVVEGFAFRFIESIQESLSKQAWMIQLKPVYQSTMSHQGSPLHLQLYEKVDL